ncbi:hypothetical protein CDL12_20592 [Handroanthus impetiginosus]|uniref:Uncharacterized protein n=1 Tax=Handroanthus impetiginosus TaxID=429701 RepID=A0A2G9GNG3_9LAMI|nr:hypothetical protein CDL12_20592 [Handroanthus impetiginosus]
MWPVFYFKDILPFPRSHQLIILDDESQSIDKGTCLMVRTPIAEKARWGDVLQFAGEYVFSRCKRKLDARKIYDFVYASLFTYDQNFKVMKTFFEAWPLYDEVIPSLEKLTGVDQTNNRYIPRSYKYLFHTCHLLQKSAIGGPKMTQFSSKDGTRYFDPKETRKRIHQGDSANWTYDMFPKNQNLLYVNDGNDEKLEQDYFITIHSNYFPLYQGEHFVIEPYSSHRFSGQFGYYQEVPGVLRHDFRQADLENGLYEGANPPIDNDHYIQIVEITESLKANKRKSYFHPLEGSSTDCY